MSTHKIKHIALFAAVFCAVILTSGSKARAATLTVATGSDTIAVDGSCKLSEAIIALNNAANTVDCVKTGAAYGNGDSLQIPAGTLTLTEDLPALIMTGAVSITGASSTSSIIDAGGKKGFYSDSTTNFTLSNMKIMNATPYAINIHNNADITVASAVVDNSFHGIRMIGKKIAVDTLTVQNCNSLADTGSEAKTGAELQVSATESSDTISIVVTDSKFINNAGGQGNVGLTTEIYNTDNFVAASAVMTVRRSVVSQNSGQVASGLGISTDAGNTAVDLSIDAVTVANNVTVPLSAAADQNFTTPAYTSGFFLQVSKLTERYNFSNVTVVNNRTTNSFDDHLTIAGLFGITINTSNKVKIASSTIVGNTAIQTNPGAIANIGAIGLINVTIVDSVPTVISTGGSMTNSLLASNTTNGLNYSCNNVMTAAVYNLNAGYDLTPMDESHNITDDSKCTGYKLQANLYDTIEHEVADNGGPVPTIKLLPGSPAIDSGGQVLGISTDARGIAREGYYSSGAYQGVKGAASTNTVNVLATTGALAVSATLLAGILISSIMYLYIDYRKHKKPLLAVDPTVRYGLYHHMKVVTLPLLKYRLQFRIESVNAQSDVHKF